MSYLFDDASNHRLSKTGALGAISISAWFYPDDSAAECTIYSEHNAGGTQYMRIRIAGSGSDKVILESTNAITTVEAASTGTVNYNAWNHVYAARGVASPSAAYISLNGESLVTGSFQSGTLTGTAIGVTGTTTRTNYMSGRIAEVGLWDNCLNDFDDRYKGLALGYSPRMIPVDPGGTAGLDVLNLLSYTPLIGNLADLVIGNSWSALSSPTVAEHCRMFRQYAA